MFAGMTEVQPVEKIMSASREEFARCLAVLLGSDVAPDLPARVAVASGLVVVGYEPLAPARLGGLLDLPRARVTLSFQGVSPAEADEFLRRFDLAFQRGGG